MKPGRWLMAHWPGADIPGAERDGAEPDREEAVGTGDEVAGEWSEQPVEPTARRASRVALACSTVGRGVTAPVRGGAALARTSATWLVSHWPGMAETPRQAEPALDGSRPARARSRRGRPLPLGPKGPLAGPALHAVQDSDLQEAAEHRPLRAAGDAHSPELDDSAQAEAAASRRRPRWLRRPRRVPLLGLRQVSTVFGAVYTALADPIVGADRESRERRAAQARKVGMAAASAALVALLLYAIFPVRAFFDQWEAQRRQQDRLDVLSEENEHLEEQIERLQTDEEVERIAREQHGLIYPGDEPYVLLPAPEE